VYIKESKKLGVRSRRARRVYYTTSLEYETEIVAATAHKFGLLLCIARTTSVWPLMWSATARARRAARETEPYISGYTCGINCSQHRPFVIYCQAIDSRIAPKLSWCV